MSEGRGAADSAVKESKESKDKPRYFQILVARQGHVRVDRHEIVYRLIHAGVHQHKWLTLLLMVEKWIGEMMSNRVKERQKQESNFARYQPCPSPTGLH